jgi:putative aldouronate transport system substrate-binding protein
MIEKGQERRLYQWTEESYYPYRYDEFLPNLIFGEAEALELGEIEPSLKDAVNSAVARFVTGEMDLDQDWNTYLRQLDGLGWERYVELYQNAFDAKMAATQ